MKTTIISTFICLCFLINAHSQTLDRTVDKFARFPDGVEKFYEYVSKHVVYPEDAKKDSLNGFVYVEFFIGTDGTILPESVKILQGLSPSCDAEAIRVIKDSPKWVAATSKAAKPMEQRVSFPVKFVYP